MLLGTVTVGKSGRAIEERKKFTNSKQIFGNEISKQINLRGVNLYACVKGAIREAVFLGHGNILDLETWR